MDPIFSSRDARYRDPFGAVQENTRIHFKIRLPRDLRCSSAYLFVRDDDSGNNEVSSMFWCGMDGDSFEFWECHYTPKREGLYWYHFEMDTCRGRLSIMRDFGGTGRIGSGSAWQLTVYDESFKTPDWLTGGIMYQIFPDRFAYSGTPKQNVPPDRTLRTDWGGQPEWRPNAQGVVTNSDYFCGDLEGIAQKLDYLSSLGVTCIYLNPIFEAHSNHRYNTADYMKIDPLLGTEQDFTELCEQARAKGIRILLDGVFNHTGSDSVYFNREGRYDMSGACNTQNSPYCNWYRFSKWPNRFNSWWGFSSLPEVDEGNPEYERFINGESGVVRKWLKAGASGWRLDVADELPDPFLKNLREAAKAEKPDALVLGEVWEDASSKESYGRRRQYLFGYELDSVMNYPFRNAILGFLTGSEARQMLEIILNVLENYPPQVIRILMNHIGTHDTERALTMLGGEPMNGRGREWQCCTSMSAEQRKRGLRLLRLAALLQYTLPGVPCVYYGDETGMEGYRDPFNRGCFPWGHEDKELQSWYQLLASIRKGCSALREGAFVPVVAQGRILSYVRQDEGSALLCAVNAGSKEARLTLPAGWETARTALGNLPVNGELMLPPESGAVLVK